MRQPQVVRLEQQELRVRRQQEQLRQERQEREQQERRRNQQQPLLASSSHHASTGRWFRFSRPVHRYYFASYR